jgi:hypothetical protein
MCNVFMRDLTMDHGSGSDQSQPWTLNCAGHLQFIDHSLHWVTTGVMLLKTSKFSPGEHEHKTTVSTTRATS